MGTAIIFVAILAMGFADVYRGAQAGLPRAIEKALLGFLALVPLLGHEALYEFIKNWPYFVGYLIAFSVGCSISWGAVISGSLKKDSPEKFQAHVNKKQDKGDWYLVGWFRTSPMRGLFARAMLWGALPGVVLWAGISPEHGIAMFAAYTLAMLLAVKLLHYIENSTFDKAVGRMCLSLVQKDRAWARHEVYRGWIAGLLLLVFGLLL